jgi:hypothetical protein
VCGRTIEKFEVFAGTFEATFGEHDYYQFDVCQDCLTDSDPIIAQVDRRSDLRERRAAALRTDPLLTEEADELDRLAADQRAAARRLVLPTAQQIADYQEWLNSPVADLADLGELPESVRHLYPPPADDLDEFGEFGEFGE